MEADFLIIADAIQVSGDKLSMLGGAWTFVFAREFPANHPMGLAAGLLVDWNETNIAHDLTMTIRNEDTGTEVWKAEGTFEQGRAAGTPPGVRQRVLVGFNLTLLIAAPGDLVAEIIVDGQSLRKTPFKAVASRTG